MYFGCPFYNNWNIFEIILIWNQNEEEKHGIYVQFFYVSERANFKCVNQYFVNISISNMYFMMFGGF